MILALSLFFFFANCHVTIAQHRLMVAGEIDVRSIPHDGS